MHIDYQINRDISVARFSALLHRSGLAARRPVDDQDCLAGMLANSNLIVSAWCGEDLVGIARSVSDFHYCCYLSDLAVDREYQNLGIGKQLQMLTQQQLGPRCKLILLAAPDANDYYRHVGYQAHPRCWVLERDSQLSN